MTEARGHSQDSQGKSCMALGQSLLHSVWAGGGGWNEGMAEGPGAAEDCDLVQA